MCHVSCVMCHVSCVMEELILSNNKIETIVLEVKTQGFCVGGDTYHTPPTRTWKVRLTISLLTKHLKDKTYGMPFVEFDFYRSLWWDSHCDLIVRLNDDCLDVTGCHGVTGPGVAAPDHITSSVRFPNDN